MSRFAPPIVASRLLSITGWIVVALVVTFVVATRTKQKLDRRQKIATGAFAATIFGFYVLSCPYCSNRLAYHVEIRNTDAEAKLAAVDAKTLGLVLLSGGLRSDDGDIPASELLDSSSMARTLAAARVYQTFHPKKVIASGGPRAMGRGMRDLLIRLGVPEDVILLDIESFSTRQNAQNSAAILKANELEGAILVTSSLHLRRASREFAALGIPVYPIPSDILTYTPGRSFPLTDLLPSADALQMSEMAVHEMLGNFRDTLVGR